MTAEGGFELWNDAQAIHNSQRGKTEHVARTYPDFSFYNKAAGWLFGLLVMLWFDKVLRNGADDACGIKDLSNSLAIRKVRVGDLRSQLLAFQLKA